MGPRKPAGWVAVLLVALACARTPVAAAPEGSAPESLGRNEVVMLYHSPCVAACPVYSVRVTPEGRIIYDGRERVARLGSATAQITQPRLDALLHELEAAGYFLFADRYRPSEPVCGRYVPDAPTVITSVRLRDRVKRIEHDQGCGNAPQALTVLERRIDEVLGTRRWTHR